MHLFVQCPFAGSLETQPIIAQLAHCHAWRSSDLDGISSYRSSIFQRKGIVVVKFPQDFFLVDLAGERPT